MDRPRDYHSEVSQIEKDKYDMYLISHMISLICGILKKMAQMNLFIKQKWSHKCRKQTCGYQEERRMSDKLRDWAWHKHTTIHIKWKSLSRVQLCNPRDYTIHGILQARILERIAIPFSRGSSQLRDQTRVSHIAGRFFTSWATYIYLLYIK